MTKDVFGSRKTMLAAALLATTLASPAVAWEPSKPVEFVVPAGTGGGADQMARLMRWLWSTSRAAPAPRASSR
jgi:tripartite-type tricarboxylate transporter receptor subunit TctC